MSNFFKICGKKVELNKSTDLNKKTGEWIFAPGGFWVLREPLENGGYKQTRIFGKEVRNQLSVSILGRSDFKNSGSTWVGDIQKKTFGKAQGSSSGDDSSLTAQFPGKVRKVLVADGQAVKEGEKLVLVEAMKMEFTIAAPKDGQVKKVCVKEGDQLSPGVQLVEME